MNAKKAKYEKKNLDKITLKSAEIDFILIFR